MPDTELKNEKCQGQDRTQTREVGSTGEKQKWGRTNAGTNLKKEMKLGTMAMSEKGTNSQGGIPFCAMHGFSIII